MGHWVMESFLRGGHDFTCAKLRTSVKDTSNVVRRGVYSRMLASEASLIAVNRSLSDVSL